MTQFWIKLLDQFTLHQKQVRLALLGVCGFALVCGAGALAWYFISPGEPPDPAKEDLTVLSKYIRSEAFLKAGSQERGEYVNKLMNRYKQMPPAEKREAQDKFGTLFRKDRQTRKTFWLSYVQNQADQYNKLSQQQKRQRIDAILTMAEAMNGKRQMRSEFREKGSVRPRKMTKKQEKKGVDRFRRNIPFVLKTTSAKDRAKIITMAKDMMNRMQEKYGDR